MSGAAARAQQLEQDNVGLYERIRFLQRYQGSQAGERGNSAYKIVNVDSAGVRHNVRLPRFPLDETNKFRGQKVVAGHKGWSPPM